MDLRKIGRHPAPYGVPDAHENRAWCLVSPRDLFESADRHDWEGTCRRLAVATYMGADTVLCRALARFKMFVSASDEGLAPHLIGDGFWEMWVTRAMTRSVQPGMVCIDAGANIGYYSILLAELTGTTGKVIAAEPMPATRRYLERNVSINGFTDIVEITNAALGAEPGEVTLYMPPGEPKNALICAVAPHPDWESATVPRMAIDDLGLRRVDFVKIDVEGAEIDVWRGMQATIAANPQIQIMIEVNCRRYSQIAPALLAEMAALFPLRQIDHTGECVAISAEEILAAHDDLMLYLARR